MLALISDTPIRIWDLQEMKAMHHLDGPNEVKRITARLFSTVPALGFTHNPSQKILNFLVPLIAN